MDNAIIAMTKEKYQFTMFSSLKEGQRLTARIIISCLEDDSMCDDDLYDFLEQLIDNDDLCTGSENPDEMIVELKKKLDQTTKG